MAVAVPGHSERSSLARQPDPVDKGVNGATWSRAVELLAVPFIPPVHLLIRRRKPWLILIPAALARIALFSPPLLFRVPYLYLFRFLFIWGWRFRSWRHLGCTASHRASA
jgi:hypothetical protein